jgi:ankyrin repeat protein
LLLKIEANVKNRDFLIGVTLVHYLAKTGNVALLAFLVERTWCTVDLGMVDRVKGILPIHLASLNSHTEVVRMLLTWTQNLHNDSVSGSRLSPLMCAAHYNHLSVIRVIAEPCANENYTNTESEGLTALHCAVMNGNEETVNELLNTVALLYPSSVNNKMSPVHYAAANGYLNLLHENEGILDLPVRDENGDLPIHLASKRGHENIARWLLERQEFSLFAWNKRGKTPLHIAIVFRRIIVIVYIIGTAGTHVDMTTLDAFKLTPLHLASSVGDETIINYLLDRKTDPNRMSADNPYTTMHYATMKFFPEGIKLLYQAGGNVHVNAREEAGTGGGEPLLITAVKYNSCDAGKFLLSIKADVNPDYQHKR